MPSNKSIDHIPATTSMSNTHSNISTIHPPLELNKSSRSISSSLSSHYEEHIIVETLDQGVFGFDPGVKNELGQESGELLKATLRARHVIMISLGGVVGTGLFLGEQRR